MVQTAAERAVAQNNPLNFTVPITAALGAVLGFLGGQAAGLGPLVGLIAGAVIAAILAFVLATYLPRTTGRWVAIAACALLGFIFGSLAGLVAGAIAGAIIGWCAYWLSTGAYRAGVPPYATTGQVLWHNGFRLICGLIFFFLIAPIIIVVPLSFNAQDFFTFTPEMLALKPEGYSLKHYRNMFEGGGNPWLGLPIGLWSAAVLAAVLLWLRKISGGGAAALIVVGAFVGLVVGKLTGLESAPWMLPLKNSLIIAPFATLISVSLGTLAAIGLSQSHVPFRRAIMAIMISPMIVPLIISATGMFFFYSQLGLWLEDTFGMSKSFTGYIKVILAHAALGIPFVIITVTATLVGFDNSLTRAAANMGANPVTTFFRVQMPLILPGVISGGLFAFITSFDEVVVVLFVGAAAQKTLPWQMFTGLREQISPTILAVATILVLLSVVLLATLELLRRRSERLRGMSPG